MLCQLYLSLIFLILFISKPYHKILICINILKIEVKKKKLPLIIWTSTLAICFLSNVQAKHLANNLEKIKKDLETEDSFTYELGKLAKPISPIEF